ncbi:uncharacterized protein CLAFUR5_05322 [Fulvia fulva]|uniref:Uncharacterized protein n=1 Tax=Passalora fulva TaxID=5499 RepID=A0A9Q8LG56_PASFU|nr:uncharacterized protein CLAFUR5_05322 [Fulvia fulva]KAK4616622.1 hypothetical protein CLAFUR0_10719 [Fulvia fulva]UJO16788.1 hypothetical protein CLAFUR5_05322 [Fulvia fulva]
MLSIMNSPNNRTNLARLLYNFDDFLRHLYDHWIKTRPLLYHYGLLSDDDYAIDDAFKQEHQYLVEEAHAAHWSQWAAVSHMVLGDWSMRCRCWWMEVFG